jgi:prevent-host-death family protein
MDLVHDLVHILSVRSINVHEAKTQFSKLLARVAKGQEVIISRAGKPVARLVPHEAKPPVPVFGADRGKFVVPDDFDASLPDEVLDAFEGRSR